jgi:hypothetical protein
MSPLEVYIVDLAYSGFRNRSCLKSLIKKFYFFIDQLDELCQRETYKHIIKTDPAQPIAGKPFSVAVTTQCK